VDDNAQGKATLITISSSDQLRHRQTSE
jgi:hypothetical protein